MAVAIVVMLLIPIQAPLSATCETPLPEDVSVERPAPNLTPEQARLFGTWGNGKWDGVLCNTLVVEAIDEKGNVKAIYSWGTYSGWNIWKGQNRVFGKLIEDNKIRFEFGNGAIVTYWFSGEELEGTYDRNNRISKVTLSRM
jgi:hypothetical protein